jgi:hypothetical protein
MGNAPPVANDFDGTLKPGEGDLAVDLRERRFRATPQVRRISGTQRREERRDERRFSRS